MKTVKNYTNSELFTLANKIRRNTGCSKSEAYQQAKSQLENPKKVSRNGASVKITEKTSARILSKYSLTVNEVYPSVKALANKMNTSVQNIYAYIKLGVFENV